MLVKWCWQWEQALVCVSLALWMHPYICTSRRFKLCLVGTQPSGLCGDPDKLLCSWQLLALPDDVKQDLARVLI